MSGHRNNVLRHRGRKFKNTAVYNLGWAVEDPPEKDGLRVTPWWTIEADDRLRFNLGNGGRRVPARGSMS